ncbi:MULTISPECIES: hypothetical protein [unclassified Streptomyces]|uniref:hypothetical protein n=1 Tax=unclassified Streptomyces TaxID=2593676 RepID=UPI0028C3AD4C|nr:MULTISPECIES: hypothetical protein [unclassified Streptomyces]WNO76001.1 hypothetical protein RPQ07_32280 [Streptomyces sp. AM8-1-1]
MSETYPPPPSQPPTAPAARSRWSHTLTVALIGFSAGAGIVGAAWWATSATSDSKETTTVSAAASATTAAVGSEPFDLTGTFVLTDGVISDGATSCKGSGGYDDIGMGTSVTVYDAAGAVIGSSGLFISTHDKTAGTCTYQIAVEAVPGGHDFYQVEISHRGKIQLSAADARAGSFAGSLG